MSFKAVPFGEALFSAVDTEVVSLPFQNPFNPATHNTFRAVRANEAGSISYVSYAGQTRTAHFLAGETRAIAGRSIISASGITTLEVGY